ncbi:LADA_0A05182g1_1 [Lachancea dasiensis]|uniref:LADA_0A05182g1_1 n=1 Tax=Lachancea dasiensis TaxID=1072105 RepID=A0A1G4INT0_9SACH|nr:LADA_0A05182g1_1 [Lachancea dasiensis]
MSSLYRISTDVKNRIKKFRTATARTETLKALVLKIQPKPSCEITIDESEDEQALQTGFDSLEELGEELPDNTPRYVLLSYPMTTSDGRKQTPLVLLYWKPATVVSQEWKMLYAGALEMMRNECGVSRVIEVSTGLEDDEDIQEVREQIEL